MNKLIIFDLDGVITSEAKYWDMARLVVGEIVGAGYFGLKAFPPSPAEFENFAARTIPQRLIYPIKAQAINSNWDLSYIMALCHLSAAQKGENWAAGLDLAQRLLTDNRGLYGADFLAAWRADLGDLAQANEADFWEVCYHIFQAWHHGGRASDLILSERGALPSDEIKTVLAALRDRGYTLASATGRPRDEAIPALEALGVLGYFDAARFSTYDDVLSAEAQIGGGLSLGKPHPYPILRAVYPEMSAAALLNLPPMQHEGVVMIGDGVSDVKAALAAGCAVIGILDALPEPYKTAKREAFAALGCEIILDDLRGLKGVL